MDNLFSYILASLERSPDLPALVGRSGSEERTWTRGQLLETARSFAAGLAVAGMDPGDHVGIIADSGDHWLIADLGVLTAAGVDIPRGADSSLEDVAFILEHARCRWVVVENVELFEKHRPTLAKHGLEERTVVLEGDVRGPCRSMQDVLTLGRQALREDASLLERRAKDVTPKTLATIVYTSGTTGNPKGVMLTHGNVLHNVRILPKLVTFSSRDRYLSFLPTWHMFERTLEYCLLVGETVIHFSDKRSLRRDLRRIRPTVMAGVPRLWESLQSAALAQVRKLPAGKRHLMQGLLALAASHDRAARLLTGRSLDDSGRIRRIKGVRRWSTALGKVALTPFQKLADRLLFAPFRATLGDSLRFIISGGGALPIHVDEFFDSAGVLLLNGYGLTETSPVLSLRDPRRNVLGTSGQRLPETEWEVRGEDGKTSLPPGEKGILWVRGPQVMSGYFRNPEATHRVLVDGWFNTGDLARLTARDDVIICGRAKDTIVLRGGENVEPEVIEARLLQSPFISDVVVVGHTKKHLGALVIPDREALAAFVPADRNRRGPALPEKTIVNKILHEEVTRLVSPECGFRVFERVPRITCLEQSFSVEDGTLTPTLKKRRSVIEARYAAQIEALFDG